MHANPLLAEIVDTPWRQDSIKDLNIYIPESAKQFNNIDHQETLSELSRFSCNKKNKHWNDIGLYDLLCR